LAGEFHVASDPRDFRRGLHGASGQQAEKVSAGTVSHPWAELLTNAQKRVLIACLQGSAGLAYRDLLLLFCQRASSAYALGGEVAQRR
jgi:hypothetical protein